MHRHGDVGQLILDSSELRRAAAAALGGEDLSVDEHLSTPHAPWQISPVGYTFVCHRVAALSTRTLFSGQQGASMLCNL